MQMSKINREKGYSPNKLEYMIICLNRYLMGIFRDMTNRRKLIDGLISLEGGGPGGNYPRSQYLNPSQGKGPGNEAGGTDY